jgi:NADPH:quinone reductase-like Zn-dependent oxidoreductase
VDIAAAAAAAAAAATTATTATAREQALCMRGERRFVARIRRMRTLQKSRDETGAEAESHSAGTYAVTGGAGGLGLVFCAWLVRQRRAGRVLMIGRREQPHPAEFEAIARLARDCGTDVQYASADVSRTE